MVKVKWLYKKNGKSLGPVNEDDILKLIEEDILDLDDLVCRQGEPDWASIRSFECFNRRKERAENLHQFVELPESQEEEEFDNSSWVLLKKKVKSKQTKFIQSGPFSTEKLLKKIISGEANFSDYVWKKGMTQWKRVGSVEAFDRRDKDDGEETLGDLGHSSFPNLVLQTLRSKLNQVTHRLLDKVIVEPEEKNTNSSEDEAPPETDGLDLTSVPVSAALRTPPATDVDIMDTASIELKEDVDLEAPPEEELQENPENEEEKSPKAKKKLVDTFLGMIPKSRLEKLRSLQRRRWVFGIGLLLLAGALFVLSSRSPLLLPAPETLEAPREKKEVFKPKLETIEIVENPYLKIIAQSDSSSDPYLLIKSNAAPGQKVYVTVLGEHAEIVGPPSFYRRQVLLKKRDEDLIFRFKDVRAPKGKVQILVESAKSRKELLLFLGQKGRSFLLARDGQLKRYSFQQQQEKKQLFYLAQSHIGQLERFFKKIDQGVSKKTWPSFYRKWSKTLRRSANSKLKKINYSTRNQYVFPEHWLDFKGQREHLLGEITSLDDPLRANQQRHPKSPLRRIFYHLKLFREKMGRLSVNRGS